MNPFKETKALFSNAISVDFPLSYEGWLAVKADLKAAALFVNFYDQITLAWSKAKSEFTADEDGVSIVMQYLIKNVPIISDNEKKYNPSYIYRVAYNCMGCLRRVQREQDRYSLTTGQYAVVDDDNEVDLFATIIGDDCDMVDNIYHKMYISSIWSIISQLDETEKDYIEYLLGRNKLMARARKREDAIVEDLKSKLRKYKPMCYSQTVDTTLRFSSVLKHDDDVSSAVVEMSDGSKAVYYGETRVLPNGDTRVVFFGDKQDYIVPVQIAKHLKVLDVQMY